MFWISFQFHQHYTYYYQWRTIVEQTQNVIKIYYFCHISWCHITNYRWTIGTCVVDDNTERRWVKKNPTKLYEKVYWSSIRYYDFDNSTIVSVNVIFQNHFYFILPIECNYQFANWKLDISNEIETVSRYADTIYSFDI